MTDNYSDKREFMRYVTEPFPFILIGLMSEEGGTPLKYSGLVVDQGHGGCGIVTSSTISVKQNDTIWVKTEKLGKMKAEVRWQKKLEFNLIVIGIRYLN